MAKIYQRSTQDGFSTVDPGQSMGVEHNILGGGKNVVEVGPALTQLPSASFTAGSDVGGLGTSLYLYNNSATVAFVAFYDPTVTPSPATPTAAAGIAVPPNAYFRVNSGQVNSMIISTANILIYRVAVGTVLVAKNSY